MLSLDLGRLVLIFGVLLFSLTVHESAHAWTAARLGDRTGQRLGRISLNPFVHVDPVGTLLLPLMAFVTGAPVLGWAKPVPVNPLNLEYPRRDFMLIALAGPASNLVMAVVAAVAMRMLPITAVPVGGGFEVPLWGVMAALFEIYLLLAVFNLIPVPPLDGGNVLAALLPWRAANLFDRFIRPWGFLVLLVLFYTGTLVQLINPPYAFLSWLLTA